MKQYMGMKHLALGACLLMLSSMHVNAQEAENADDILGKKEVVSPVEEAVSKENAANADEVQKSLDAAKAELLDPETLKKKVALAKEMHKIRPTRDQVDSAVKRAALGLPQHEQQPFINAMRGILNYNAIERISMDRMVEVYTLQELEAMVEYYSRPEAKSASKKMIHWASGIQPEIVRMIDKAMMRIKTGE